MLYMSDEILFNALLHDSKSVSLLSGALAESTEVDWSFGLRCAGSQVKLRNGTMISAKVCRAGAERPQNNFCSATCTLSGWLMRENYNSCVAIMATNSKVRVDLAS